MIVHQMLKKIRVEESGDSEVLPGTSMDVLDFNEMNEALLADGKKPAEGKQVLLGITKASLATDSFLSAASFQETTKVLTEAAINGKVDHLIGLKERKFRCCSRRRTLPSARPKKSFSTRTIHRNRCGTERLRIDVLRLGSKYFLTPVSLYYKESEKVTGYDYSVIQIIY